MGKRSTRRKSEVSFKQYNFLNVTNSPSRKSSNEGKKHLFSPNKSSTSSKKILTFTPKSAQNLKERFEEVTHNNIEKNSSPTKRRSMDNIKKRRNARKLLTEILESATKPSKTTEPVQDSEDVIESSQEESHVDLTISINSSSDEGKIVKQQLHSTFSQLVSNIMLIESESLDPIQEEVVKDHIDLTIDNLNTEEMDTETMEMCTEQQHPATPQKSINTIPTSPVNLDTPTRTCELITDTLDISPIKISETNYKTPDLFESEIQDLELGNVEVEIGHEDDDEDNQSKSALISTAEVGIGGIENLCSNLTAKDTVTVEKMEDSCLVSKQEIVTEKNDDLQNKMKHCFSARSVKLLKLVPWKPASPATKRITKTVKSPALVLPKDRRTIHIFKQCEKQLEFQKQDQNITEIPLSEDLGKMLPDDVFLKFVKEVPSPKASPRCSILKRKASEAFEEVASPLRKKRVNFPDPPLTSKKLYYPDENEHLITSEEEESNGVQTSNNNTEEEKSNGVQITEINNVDASPSIDSELPDSGTQGSINVEDVQLLDRVKPIYPDLVDSKESIDKIATLLGDPMFASSLLDTLQTKNIFSVGDLAKLTEVEINRLPIKSPKIKNLTTILTNFKMTISTATEGEVLEQKEVNETEQQEQSVISQPKQKRRIPLQSVTVSNCKNCNNFKPLIMEPILPTTVLIPEIQPEDVLRKLLEDFASVKAAAVKQGVNIAGLCREFISISEPDIIINQLRENDTFKLSSIVKENDWPMLLKQIVENAGLKKLIALLCEASIAAPEVLLETVIDQSVESYKGDPSHYFQQATNRLIELTPITVTLNHLGLHRVVREVHKMCTDSYFSTADFFQYAINMFSPSIEEIIPCFRHINVVNIHNNLIKRTTSKDKDLFNFIDKLLDIVDTSEVCSKIPKKDMLSLFNVEELTDGIIATSSTDSIIQTCTKLVEQLPQGNATDNVYETLVVSLFKKVPPSDLVRYIGDYLRVFADTVKNPN